MDSNKIKNLAFGARDALRAEVAARIDAVLEPGSPERLDLPEKVRRLEAAIDDKGMDAVVESMAYTWFNRLCALRFMDAKGYTPVPVVTPRPGTTQPAILADAAQGVFDPDFGFSRLVRDRVQSVLAGGSSSSMNRTEAAYGELLIAVCDYYAEAMPYLFGESAASSLVMPQSLLAEGSILGRIVEDMDDEECETVEVLGWLYQFYVAERRAEINASKEKRAANDIAPATQLFTPKWVVRYLVDNSLGRLWMLNNPGSELVNTLDYFISAEAQNEDYLRIFSPEELTMCDPACGSGHILVYAFDVLYEIYQEEGYLPEDIPELILRNNLFGMEIDGRAAEIAKFALEMKAREKDPRFFDKHIDANITVLSSITFDDSELHELDCLSRNTQLLDELAHVGENGSLFQPKDEDICLVADSLRKLEGGSGIFETKAAEKLEYALKMLRVLDRRYSCLAANPPYMGYRLFNAHVFDWTKEHYPTSYFDLCAAFIERGFSLIENGGFLAEVTMHTWATDKSYRKMRNLIFNSRGIECMMHMSSMVMPIAFETSATVFSDKHVDSGVYFKVDSSDLDDERQLQPCSFSALRRWKHAASSFKSIPEEIIAYTLPEKACLCLQNYSSVADEIKPRVGIQTGDTPRFVRYWWEPSPDKVQFPSDLTAGESNKQWFPYKNGGEARKWYGNALSVVNWEHDGYEVIDRAPLDKRKVMGLPIEYRFRQMVSWGEYGYGDSTFRFAPAGYLFDVIEPAFVDISGCNTRRLMLLLGFLNSSVASLYIHSLMPGRHKNVGKMGQLPFSTGGNDDEICELVSENVRLAQDDWNSSEVSWDFPINPLVRWAQTLRGSGVDDVSISDCFECWRRECQERFETMKANEEELNSIFVKAYELSSVLDTAVPDSKITVRLANQREEVVQFLSYAVGCIMGRYSIGIKGLKKDETTQLEGQCDSEKLSVFSPDRDAIVPILDDQWFEDDVVAQVTKLVEVVFGKSTLEENLSFIESALGKKMRLYFANDYYEDHYKMYFKRPIYWMFASPKGSFQVLVYMHRYTPSTVGQILTKYLREYVEKLNAKIGQLEQSDRAADNRQADRYRAVVRELTDWERDVIYPLANERIDIDLDDGVKVNYNKFPHALAKVAGLSTWR